MSNHYQCVSNCASSAPDKLLRKVLCICWFPRPEICPYIPGCQTPDGKTAYGGLCVGEGCSHLDKENCLNEAKNVKTLKESSGDAGDATSANRTKIDRPCEWRNSWKEVSCHGDWSRWQNPACSFTNDKEACMWMPGCMWEGQNYFGGWCMGNPPCSLESSKSACIDAQCTWQEA